MSVVESTAAGAAGGGVGDASATLRLLLDTVSELSLSRHLSDVQRIVRGAARRLLSADGASFVLRVLGGDDLVAHYGGEEFAVLFHDCEPAAAMRIAERLRQATPDDATASIGLARWDGVEHATSLTRRADGALYDAKRAGRNRVVFAG